MADQNSTYGNPPAENLQLGVVGEAEIEEAVIDEAEEEALLKIAIEEILNKHKTGELTREEALFQIRGLKPDPIYNLIVSVAKGKSRPTTASKLVDDLLKQDS